MQIIIRTREVYGVRTFYPVCPTARLFADIAGTKTLTLAALQKIKALGYTVQLEQLDPQTI